MTKKSPLKTGQNTDNCEIEQDTTLQRAINYVKPTRPLEQGADGLPSRDGGRVMFTILHAR
jgi:hypothetical protein